MWEIRKFETNKDWSIDRWWKKEDLIEFKIIEKENVADLNAFSGLVENISYKLRDFSSSIKVISLIKESENKSNSFKEILLSDIFEIKEGLTKYTKKNSLMKILVNIQSILLKRLIKA